MKKRSPATQLRYTRRDLQEACRLLDMAAADLSIVGRSIDSAHLRQRSSDYAAAAHRLAPRMGR